MRASALSIRWPRQNASGTNSSGIHQSMAVCNHFAASPIRVMTTMRVMNMLALRMRIAAGCQRAPAGATSEELLIRELGRRHGRLFRAALWNNNFYFVPVGCGIGALGGASRFLMFMIIP